MRRLSCALLGCVCAAACDRPAVAPTLDQFTCDGGLCGAPGVIQGQLVYGGTRRGDAILLLFDTAALPPPDGNGSSAASVARIPAATLFRGAPAAGIGPFSAPFTFSQVPSGRSYQVRAFLDATHEFDPFFSSTRQPRKGDPAGGHGQVGALLSIPVSAGQVVSGVSVSLTQTLEYDPPSFEIAGGSQTVDQALDQPFRMKLRIARLSAPGAAFQDARFALELDRDVQGNRRSSFGDGLDDVFPRVFLRQLAGADGAAVAAVDAAIVPCRVVATAVLPALVNLPAGSAPLPRDTLDVLIEPRPLAGRDLGPLPQIPAGKYQVVVVQRSGQFWILPNELGDPANAGTSWSAPSQAQSVTFAPSADAPANSLSGTVSFRGDPALKSGNIVVQAYRDDPYNPPPPVGAALPVRVQIIPASATVPDASGFTAPYRIGGLPAGNYIVQALDDLDGNFTSLNLLATPTANDLGGAVFDASSGRPASVAVSGDVTGKDLSLAFRMPADPPAFEIDPATPAEMPADQVIPVRFNVRAKALSFPAGKAVSPHFAVQLMRDSSGAAVDADHDGLPDVWPRVFLIRLDPSDPAGLTQYVSPDPATPRTQLIPAAVDPTPFLPALQPQPGGNAPPVITDKLAIVVRPALFDASTPGGAPQRLSGPEPGAYRIVLLSQSGQAWQIPNEAGSAALDPSVVCPAAATTCPPGTVQTQSQSRAFQVGPPAHPVSSGRIAGTLTVRGSPPIAAAWIFAYAANAQPPFGSPVAADFHAGADFQSGFVPFVLPDLPPGSYVVSAVVDTRGDFAPSTLALLLAPGAGNLVAGATGVSVGAGVTALNLTTSAVLPQRPSFELVDSEGHPLIADQPPITLPASIRIKAVAVLGPSVAGLHADGAAAFVTGCDSRGKPSLSIELLKLLDADPAGLTPDLDAFGKATVLPAALDSTQFAEATCPAGAPYAAAGPLTVIVESGGLKVNLVDPYDPPTSTPAVPGRYAVVVTSFAKQVWRVPNELQAALLDPAAALVAPPATKFLLQTQQVAVHVTP